ncbi:MAG: RNA pyrophosphohydrolase [Methyloligellaceae bacterium]
MSDLPYRKCVGIFLLNRSGKVWVGRRIGKTSKFPTDQLWQMPQGGIDNGEDPKAAAFRELKEEIGTDNATVLAESREWLHYDLPKKVQGKALKGRYRGQAQKWFAMRFEGSDDDFDLNYHGEDNAEFDAWRWTWARDLPDIIIEFKRDVYKQIVNEFADLAADPDDA